MSTATDKELLTLAAKAAGLELEWEDCSQCYWISDEEPWCPLEDDGDALRLAVKLKLMIDVGPGYAEVKDPEHERGQKPIAVMEYFFNDDPYAATRRAIVRAAAEIGRGME